MEMEWKMEKLYLNRVALSARRLVSIGALLDKGLD
jgi:hypothetical protein